MRYHCNAKYILIVQDSNKPTKLLLESSAECGAAAEVEVTAVWEKSVLDQRQMAAVVSPQCKYPVKMVITSTVFCIYDVSQMYGRYLVGHTNHVYLDCLSQTRYKDLSTTTGSG